MEDIDEAIRSLKEKKVRFVMEKFESPVCWMAIIAHPDGNSL